MSNSATKQIRKRRMTISPNGKCMCRFETIPIGRCIVERERRQRKNDGFARKCVTFLSVRVSAFLPHTTRHSDPNVLSLDISLSDLLQFRGNSAFLFPSVPNGSIISGIMQPSVQNWFNFLGPLKSISFSRERLYLARTCEIYNLAPTISKKYKVHGMLTPNFISG